jgi:aspartate ammonia-lyase
MSEYRVERDSTGDVRHPTRDFDGGQAQRAVANFPISGCLLPTSLMKADPQANIEACAVAVEQSLSAATNLNPLIGYQKAASLPNASLPNASFRTGKTIHQPCLEEDVLPETTLQVTLNPLGMTNPQV